MNHLILSIIIVLGCTSNLFAQFNIGVKGGLSVSNVNFSGIEIPSNYRLGMSIGIPISYDISKRVIVGLNTDFIQKGYNLEFNGQSNFTQFKYNYLQFTPNIKFLVVNNLQLGIGLYYAIKLDEFNKVGDDEWIDTGKFNIIKNNDFGISPTIGYSHKKFLFQLSYHYGLRNIANINFTDSNGEIVPDVKLQNKAFEIGLAYMFAINEKTDDNKP
jgi:hypothetical protein